MEVVSIVKMILFTVAFWLFLIVIGFHTPAKRTKKITELIGFKAEQFRQIVLLPQGEFIRFTGWYWESRWCCLSVRLFKTGILL